MCDFLLNESKTPPPVGGVRGMKYQVGDKVLLLHSNEEGEVIEIINDKMMRVDVGGVKFPVYMDQVDFPYFKRFSEKKMFPVKKEKQYIDDLRKEKPAGQARVEDGVWFTILPVMITDGFGDEIADQLKLHLVNRTETAYQFIYKQHFFGKPDFELKNTINPFENFYLHDIAFADLNDSPSFDFEFTLLQPDLPAGRHGKNKAGHFETTVKLKPKQLFAKIKKLQEINQASFSHLLFEKYPDKIVEDKVELSDALKHRHKHKVYDASKAKQHMEPARTVIDLHIEKLRDDWKHLSNYEILSLQLKTFEKYFDLTVSQHQHSLTVIHGVGEGRLRDEIHEILRSKNEVKNFVNQYHPRYGYGATEIYFQF